MLQAKYRRIYGTKADKFRLWTYETEYPLPPPVSAPTAPPANGDVLWHHNIANPLSVVKSVFTWQGPGLGWCDVTPAFERRPPAKDFDRLKDLGPQASERYLVHPQYPGNDRQILTWKTAAEKEPVYIKLTGLDSKYAKLDDQLARIGAGEVISAVSDDVDME